VNTISVDCFNKPTTIECPCDVFFGGQFVANISPLDSQSSKAETAMNILKYNALSQKYDSLGGSVAHKLNSPLTSEVFKIYKKSVGVFQGLNYLWVGGSFSGAFTKYNIYNEIWGFPTNNFQFNVDSIVYDMYYHRGHLLDPDLIYIGGKFVVNTSETTTCSNLCVFDYRTEKIQEVSKNQPDGSVYSLDYLESSNTLIMGGSSTNHNLGKLRAISNPSLKSSFVDYVNSELFDVYSLTVCASQFCGIGSIASAGLRKNESQLKFWSSQMKSFYHFGNGTNGIVKVIKGVYSTGNKIQVSLFSVFIILIFILI
jgi:hypothetical protein